MCVRTHLKHALSPVEQLKYWLIGLPIVLMIAFLLSVPIYKLGEVFHASAIEALLEDKQ